MSLSCMSACQVSLCANLTPSDASMHCLAAVRHPVAVQDAAVLLQSQTGRQPSLVELYHVPNMPKITSDVWYYWGFGQLRNSTNRPVYKLVLNTVGDCHCYRAEDTPQALPSQLSPMPSSPHFHRIWHIKSLPPAPKQMSHQTSTSNPCNC